MSKEMKAEMDDFPDEVLVRAAQKGDLKAFAGLAKRYQEKIYHTLFRFTKNHTDADDLAQETFMYAFKALKSFKRKSSFYTWIYRIAVNLALNFLEKKKRERGGEEYINDVSYRLEPPSSSFSPEGFSEKNELGERLDKAIDALPLPYRMSFVLVAFQGMTHSQAAKVLRCSENTISWRMHRSRKMLQEKLRPYLK